ncbi:MAG: right-handed parallel beta-helix repeat-containing protein [Nanoarchaeota archaeon]|nr:right-handed parallel beta-helix repeat-containing protein [Nanoarchaeota archaeon]
MKRGLRKKAVSSVIVSVLFVMIAIVLVLIVYNTIIMTVKSSSQSGESRLDSLIKYLFGEEDGGGGTTTLTGGTEISSCQEINQSGNYTLIQNIVNNELTGNCFTISVQNVTLDCNGKSITSDDNYAGIYSNQKGTVIRNCDITMGVRKEGYGEGGTGIYLDRADNSLVENCTLNNQYKGILVEGGLSNGIFRNLIVNDNQDYGIYFFDSFMTGKPYFNNFLINITANNNFVGIFFWESSISINNTLTNIVANNNSYAGFPDGRGIVIGQGSGNILRNIIANNNQGDGIQLQYSSSNILTNITANENGNNGIYLSSSSNNTLNQITANSNKYDGIFLHYSSNNQLTKIITNNNDVFGIHLVSNSNSSLSNITANSNKGCGISLVESSNNTLTSITANSNNNTSGLSNAPSGIYLSQSSNNNQLTNITANSNDYGIYLGWISNNNTLTNITANSNDYGIYLGLNSNNLVHSSTACDNTQKDVYCQSLKETSGTGNKFTNVQACSDNNWPVLGVNYENCSDIPPTESGNIKNMSLYSSKELFLISDKNWKDVLPFVSAAVWTENETIKKYPFLIYHSEDGIGFPEYNPSGFLEQAAYNPAYSVGGKSLVRFYLDDLSKKEFLKQDLDIAEIGKEYVDIVLTSKQKEYFEDAGYDLETMPVNSYNPFRDNAGYSDSQYHSYESMKGELETLSEIYSNIARLYEIGKSIENRSILAMKISDNPETVEQEEKILVVGDTHAREIMTVEVPMYMIEFLLERYDSDSEIKNIVDNYELWFVPMVNPDGHVRVEGGDIWWRKNARDNNNDGIVDYNDGVDLNRNYGFTWGYDDLGSSPSPSSESYRGTSAFSEPETQAIRDLVIQNNFTYAIDYHSYAGVILYPWGHILDASADDSYFSSIANNMKKFLKSYTSGQISHVMYYSNGDSIDWEYGGSEKNKVISFGIELTSQYGFNPPASEIMPKCQEQLMMMLNLTGYGFTTREKIDADSAIYFMQQYSPSRLTIIGNTSQELDNLLIAAPELGAGLQSSQIQRVNPEDYLNYWKSYDKVVYVEDDYELALLASAYASLINVPLIIQGTENDADSVFNGKSLICVGSVSPSQGCNETYNLEQLQQRYYNLTGTKKLILVNPNDINSAASDSLQPKKTSDEITDVYGKTSLSAPILASAKHELIISSNASDAQSIDSYIENVFETNYREETDSCSYGESCASGFSNNPVDMPGARNGLSVSFKGQADVFIQSINDPLFQLNQEGNFDITIRNKGFDKASDVVVSVYEINQSNSGAVGGGGGSPYSSYSGEFILLGSASLGILDVDDAQQAVISYTPHSVGMKIIWVNVSTSSNESNTDNNARTTSVTVVGPSPDIAVVPNIPNFLRLNSNNEISVNVSNIGSLDSESVDVSLYRRVWDNGQEQNILIGTNIISSLAAGDKEIVNFSFNPQEQGYYDFYVEAITNNDASLGNNIFYFSVMAGVGEPSISLYADIPQLILVNESTNINLTLWNDGFETASNMQVEFYIQYNGQDRLLVEKRSVGGLAGRQQKTTSFNYAFNNVGYAYIIFNVSYEYQGIKSTETWYWADINLPGPDLVSYITEADSVELGQEASARIWISNEGNSIASNVTYSFYDNSVLVKRENIGILGGLDMLGAVHEKYVILSWTPSAIGEHNLIISVECDDEPNTENNNGSRTIYVYKMRNSIFEIINESGGNVRRYLGIGLDRNPETFYEITNPTRLRIPDMNSDIWIIDSINLSEEFKYAIVAFRNSALHDRMFTISKTYEGARSEGDKRLYKIYANEVYWDYNSERINFYYPDYREITNDANKLTLYYCQNWDFESTSCLSGWQETPWVDRYQQGTRLTLSSEIYGGAEAFAIGEQLNGNYSTEFRKGEGFFGVDNRHDIRRYDEITQGYGNSYYQISIPGFFYNCDTTNVGVYLNGYLQGTSTVNCYNTLTPDIMTDVGRYSYSNVRNITLVFNGSLVFYNASRIISAQKDGTEYYFGQDASSGISVIPVNSFGSTDQSSFFFENKGYSYFVVRAESPTPPDLTVYANNLEIGELDLSKSNGKKGRGFPVQESGNITISLGSKTPGNIYLADINMKTNFDDYYLTIIASPEVITMQDGGEETDFRSYGDLDGDKEGELAVGRIMGITTSDVSSYLARVLFYDSLNKEKNVVMMVRGDPRGNPVSQGIPQTTKGENFCKAYYDFECTDIFNKYAPFFEDSIVCNESVGYPYVECDQRIDEMRDGMNHSSLVVYADHGAPTGWHGVYTDNLWNLPPEFAYSFACSTCDYGYDKADLFCTNMIRSGAIGYIGAVRAMYGHHFLPEFLDETIINNKSVGYAFKIGKNKEVRYDWEIKNLEGLESMRDMYGVNDILVGDPTFDGRLVK